MGRIIELLRIYSDKIAKYEKKYPPPRSAGILSTLTTLYGKRSGLIEAAQCLGVEIKAAGLDSDGQPIWGVHIITAEG